jgi:[ribosomal protein S5]-alanine N-acetyltransferase
MSDVPLHLPICDCMIRPYEFRDRESIVRHANNAKIAQNMRDMFPHPYTDESAVAWLNIAVDQQPPTSFAIADRSGVIGGIGIILQSDIHRRSAEIGYWLGEEYWGRGIVTAAVRAFVPFAMQKFDLLRIFANVFASNPASMRVLEKVGFVHEGTLRQAAFKNGRVIDEILYAITREDLQR